MEEADGARLVQSISEKMAEMFRSKAQAARVSMSIQYSMNDKSVQHEWQVNITDQISLVSQFPSEFRHSIMVQVWV